MFSTNNNNNNNNTSFQTSIPNHHYHHQQPNHHISPPPQQYSSMIHPQYREEQFSEARHQQNVHKLPNISSFNYFHQEYAKPLTSEFRSSLPEPHPFMLSEPKQQQEQHNHSSSAEQTVTIGHNNSSSTLQSNTTIATTTNTTTTIPSCTTTLHNSSTDSSSNNSSSQESSASERPLARHSRENALSGNNSNGVSHSSFPNDDSWQSNNEVLNGQCDSVGISSFDSSFQQALQDQNMNEQNRSKKLDVLSADEIRQYFCYTQQDAARLLGVSVSTLKRRFYELKLGKRWPYKRTKQTPRKRKDKSGKISEERQLIDQGIRACSNVMILTPLSLRHSPVLANNGTSSSVNHAPSTGSSNSQSLPREITPPTNGNMSQQSNMMIEQKRIRSNNNGIEKQHKMNHSPVKHNISPTLFQQNSSNNTTSELYNRSRSSSNLSMSSSSVSSTTNPNNYHNPISSSNHSIHHQHLQATIIQSSSLNTRNENSCKKETSMEQSRKKLSLSFIMNHSDNNSEQTS